MPAPDLSRLAGAFEEALGDRLSALAVYGSAVTGDYIPGFSDIDLAIFATVLPGLAEARALHSALSATPGFASVHFQLSHWVATSEEPRPLFVPGQFRVLRGEIPAGYEHDEESLRTAGRSWLTSLPTLVRQDIQDWAVSTGSDRGRRVRLFATRLKPAIRAALVEQGHPAISAWSLPWTGLADLWAIGDPAGAAALRDVIGRLPPSPGDEATVGDILLAMLWAGMA